MRFGFGLVLAFAAGWTTVWPANAAPSEGDSTQAVAQLPSPSPVIGAVLSEIKAHSVRAADVTEVTWLSELAGYYAAPGTLPLWVGAIEVLPRAHAAAQEIRRANEYGLDPAQFELPNLSAGQTDPASLAAIEVALSLAATKYVWHAHGGRVDPSQLSLWLDQSPRVVYASTVMGELAQANGPAEVLKSHHPRHPQFELLRQAYLKARGGVQSARPSPIGMGPVLAEGDRHRDVALVRQRLGLSAGEDGADVLDEELLDEVRAFMRRNGFKKKRAIDDDVRQAVNALQDKPADSKADIEKFIVNLERWRSVPHDFGQMHIWNNLPEFETRVIKDGQLIHRERIIIGQPHTQTPVFSDAMSHVIFQPTWGVPPSIKIRQLLPRLRGGDISVFERRNMKIIDDTHVIRPSYFNWSKVDIRHVPIVQGPGPGNPLGRLKFMFPNSHDVYMHDTPDKGLFDASNRTFSHGCMRLRNPELFAEIILGTMKGWSASDIQKQLKVPDTFQVNLPAAIPVHNTYFTLAVDEASGAVRSLKDIYGHDKRVADALAGVPVARIAARDPALAQLKENQELAKRGRGDTGERYAALGRPRPAARVAPKPVNKPFFFFNSKKDDND